MFFTEKINFIFKGGVIICCHDTWTLICCVCVCVYCHQDIEELDHYEMKEEEPVDGKKSEDDGIEKENLAILEKIRKNQRQDHLNVSAHSVR